MFEQLEAQPSLHGLLVYVRQWYATATQLVWTMDDGTRHIIPQGDGGEQGDALMPALFCLALSPALAEIQGRLLPGEVVVAYLDDIYVICSRARARDAYELVKEVLQRTCHIDVNQGKLAAWSQRPGPPPSGIAELGPNVWKGALAPEDRGLKIVGTPVGTKQYIAKYGQEILREESQLLEMIPKLASLQASWLLLYFCAAPRFNHLLRTVSPSNMQDLARQHDDQLLGAFRQIFQIPSSDEWHRQLHGIEFDTWARQARLPLRFGGCGLRNSGRTSVAAYWASWADTLPVLLKRFPVQANRFLAALQAFEDGVAGQSLDSSLGQAVMAGERLDLAGMTHRPDWPALARGARPAIAEDAEVCLGEWGHGWQYYGSDAMEKLERADLLQVLGGPSRRRNAAAVGKARLYSCTGRFSSSWLTVCPTSDLTKMTDAYFRVAVLRRLGIAARAFDGDPHGHTRLATVLEGRTHARHKAMIMAWKQVFFEAGGSVPDRNIERVISNTNVPVPVGDMRRLDLVVPGLSVYGGRPLFCDVTIISPVTHQGQARPGTSNIGGALLVAAERENNDTYFEVPLTGLGKLISLGSEVYGRWSTACVELVPALARRRASNLHPRIRQGTALSLQDRWWGILAIALQTSVSRAVLEDVGADLFVTLSEPPAPVAELPIL